LVSACIVTRNAKDVLEKYLTSLLASAGNTTSLELIVVDNESTDGTQEMLARRFPQAQHLYCSPGIGFSKGINAAIQASSGEYILIATPSTQLLPNCFPALLDFIAKSKKIGVVGPKIIHPDGSIQFSSKKMPGPKIAMLHTLYLLGLLRSSHVLNEYFLFNYTSEEPLLVESLTMSLLLAKRAVFDEIGLLDETLFAWSSDVDWCHRVQQSGHWEQWFVPTAVAIHHRSSVSKKQPFTNLKYYHQDLKRFYEKHFAANSSWYINFFWYRMLEMRFAAQVIRYLISKEGFSFY
jgi:hypothetical protein